MKNTNKIFTLILLLCMVLCSCSSAVVETTVQPTAQPTPTPTPTPMPTSVEDIGRIVYQSDRRSLGGRMHFSDDYSKHGATTIQEELLQEECYVDDSVPKNITWNYLGVEFDLEYICSGYDSISFGFTDEYLDLYYSTTGSHQLKVGFLHGTNQLLLVDYDINDYKDPLEDIVHLRVEEDYVNLIKLHNQEYFKNSSDYDLECVITYEEYEGEKVTYTNLDEIKNTGRRIYRIEGYYHPTDVSDMSVRTYPRFRIFSNTAYEFDYGETDFHEYTQPIESINITEQELRYAFQEAEKFARENFSYAEEPSLPYKLAEIPFIPSETTIDVLNGRLYLVVEIHLFNEWGAEGVEPFEYISSFYVDYQRLQWKMALEGN